VPYKYTYLYLFKPYYSTHNLPMEACAITAEMSTDEGRMSSAVGGNDISCLSWVFCAWEMSTSSVSCWCCSSTISTSFISAASMLESGSEQPHRQTPSAKQNCFPTFTLASPQPPRVPEEPLQWCAEARNSIEPRHKQQWQYLSSYNCHTLVYNKCQ